MNYILKKQLKKKENEILLVEIMNLNRINLKKINRKIYKIVQEQLFIIIHKKNMNYGMKEEIVGERLDFRSNYGGAFMPDDDGVDFV